MTRQVTSVTSHKASVTHTSDEPFLTSSWSDNDSCNTVFNPQLKSVATLQINKNAHWNSISFLYSAIQNSG